MLILEKGHKIGVNAEQSQTNKSEVLRLVLSFIYSIQGYNLPEQSDFWELNRIHHSVKK